MIRASLALCGLLFGAGSALAQVGPNIDDLAKELANPGAANATLNFKLEYRSFDGDLPGASDQNSTTLTFQPVLPFILPNGNNLIFRPAFSYVWDRPQPNAGTFSTLNSWGDIPYDLLYSWRSTPGQLVPGWLATFQPGRQHLRTTGFWGPAFWR